MSARIGTVACGTVLASWLLASAVMADPWPAEQRAGSHRAPVDGLRDGTSRGPEVLSPGPDWSERRRGVTTGPVSPSPVPPASGSTSAFRRNGGVTRAIEARGEPIVIRLGHRRMTQVHFAGDIQQVVTAFTKQQVSMETAGPRLFLSALDPELSGELFVTLTGGTTVTLVVVPAGSVERDLVVRLVSPAAEAATRAAEMVGLTPLRLMRAMILNTPLPGVSPTPGDGRLVYEDGAIRLTLLGTWTSPALEGVVLAAENLRPLWISLPLDRLAFPGLLAVHVDAEQLAPPPATPEQALAARHRTRLYLVRVADGR
jgi:hypothetical protein